MHLPIDITREQCERARIDRERWSIHLIAIDESDLRHLLTLCASTCASLRTVSRRCCTQLVNLSAQMATIVVKYGAYFMIFLQLLQDTFNIDIEINR
jgi:hypothetical protein